MTRRSVEQWVNYIQTIHPRSMDLALERVRQVQARMGLDHGKPKIVSVAGTNGKGSCVAALEAVCQHQQWRVGAYTSPHLVRFNERVRIDGVPVDDESICESFGVIESRRGSIPLTYFEFCTLMAMRIFSTAALDLVVLEVGLGGRLDAVNCWDADLAFITSIGIDHTRWLGETRERIAMEKAGICRPAQPVVLLDPDPPENMLLYLKDLGCEILRPGRDFGIDGAASRMAWRRHRGTRESLGAMSRKDRRPDIDDEVLVAAVTAAKRLLHQEAGIRPCPPLTAMLAAVRLPGRLQSIEYANWPVIFDVAHNPDAIRRLADYLRRSPAAGRNLAVCSFLEDKPIATLVKLLKNQIQRWYVGELHVDRAADSDRLMLEMDRLPGGGRIFPDILQAWRSALSEAKEGDRLVVFGSFYTVGAIMQHIHWQPYANPNHGS